MNDGIEELLTEWADAERSGDAARLDRLLTEDFVGIGPVGYVLGRDAWLERFAQGLEYRSLALDEVAIRRYPGAAVVVARQRGDGTARGHATPSDVRVSFTLVPDDQDHPRIAGLQYSFNGPPAGAEGP